MKKNIRNIALMAHVDTGKTTLTEHLLFKTGAIRSRGSVDAGNTHSDLLPVERSRGISVETTCVSLSWKGTEIHLIDTPGHADFAAQVERSLWALDGAVLLVSGVEGIRPYTELLHEALVKNQIPRLIFINQCDRPHAQPEKVLEELQRFGVIFAVSQAWMALPKEADAPEEVCLFLAEQFSELEDAYLNGEKLAWHTAREYLAKWVAACRGALVFMGSAATGDGLDALLDGMAAFLPEPKAKTAELSAVIFGVEKDPQMGRGAQVRLFSGSLVRRESLEHGGETVKVTGIRSINGSQRTDAEKLEVGELGVIYGLAHAQTGDVLGNRELLPRSMTLRQLAEPLLMTEVSPLKEDDRAALRAALEELAAEDPLLHVAYSPITHQTTLRMMGAIQLEILENLLDTRYGIPVSFGSPQVIYRETVLHEGRGSAVYTMPKPCWAILRFLVEPLPLGSGVEYVCKASPARLPYRYRRQVEQTIPKALEQGMLGWEVTDVRLTLVDGEDHPIHTHPLDFVLATPWAVMAAIKDAGSQLLEPVQLARISLPQSLGGKLMTQIGLWRGTYESPVVHDDILTVEARLPVAATMELNTRLSAMSGGRATVTSRFAGYQPCPLELGQTCPRRTVHPLDTAKYILAMRNAMAQEVK